MYTSTIRLESLDLKYAPAIQIMAADADIAATTRLPHPYPPDAASQFIETGINERKAGKAYHQVIIDGDMFVGVVGLMHIQKNQQAELGYWIGKPYWGKGYASFSVKNILQIAFHELHLQMVYASVLDFNKASMRVLSKNGFSFVREAVEFDTRWKKHINLLVFELTSEQWQKHINSTYNK